jgi:flagellar biosynthetic protein FliR
MNVSEVISRLTEQTNISLVIFTMGLLMCRIMPVLVLSPLLGEEQVPPEIKMGVGITLSAVMFPLVSHRIGALPTSALPYIALLLKEIFIGVSLALIVSKVFEAARVAGNLADSMAGTNSAQLQAPLVNDKVTLLANLKVQLCVVMFFTLNGHHLVIQAIAESLDIVPLDRFPRFSQGSWPFFELFIRSFADILTIAMSLAAPTLLTAFVTDIALGAINRMASQVQVSFLAQSLKPLATVIVTSIVLSLVMGRMRTEFVHMLAMLRHALQLLG